MLSLFVATTAWTANQPVCATQRTCARASSMVVMNAEAAAKAAWLAKTAPAWSPPGSNAGSAGSANDFAGSVTPTQAPPPEIQAPPAPAESPMDMGSFVHAPLSYFAPEQLAPKGSRRSQGSLVDIGEPHDFSRPLVKGAEWNGARVGSWLCTPGGWDSPKLRPTTETFLVIDGQGAVTDADGMVHPFGPGDVVVLPKHWCGRWDIAQTIHKVWVVHDHPDVPGAADGIVRAVVAPVPPITPGVPNVPTTTPVYDLGPTRVGFVSCSPPGNFVVPPRANAEIFMVVDGVFFLTNSDGSARRFTAGDTVVVPQGWWGFLDIIEPVSKVWVDVQ